VEVVTNGGAMSVLSRLAVDPETADEVRLARIDMQAAQRRDLTLGEVLRYLIRYWRERENTGQVSQ